MFEVCPDTTAIRGGSRPQSQRSAAASRGGPRYNFGVRILFVENDAVFAEVVCGEFLRGHDVTVAPTIRAALARARVMTFDAALVDYDLDDGKGDEVVHGLRVLGFHGTVVAVSSHARGNDALVAAGADAVCPKLEFATIGSILGV